MIPSKLCLRMRTTAFCSIRDDGGEDSCLLTVSILNGQDVTRQSSTHKALGLVDGAVNIDAIMIANTTWKEDVVAAIFDTGVEEGEDASTVDKVLHVISIPWKLLFSILIPPAAYAGGWICFYMALVGIGGLTGVIIDFAELFGCVTGVEDSITAITFVALGTSMPDLFASKTAACQDDTADASIVNVTGSNSVNVFLGIGIPWTMAAVYWAFNKPDDLWLSMYGTPPSSEFPAHSFVVRGGDLGFSVIVFIIGAAIALLVLRVRRVKFGGELGGPADWKIMSAFLFVLLWVFYVGLSIWKVGNKDAGFGEQCSAILMGIVLLENVLGVGMIAFYMSKRGQPSCDTKDEFSDLKRLEEGW